VGHPGWDTHITADARYSLCITFEILEGEIDLHADVEAALVELRTEIGSLPIQLPRVGVGILPGCVASRSAAWAQARGSLRRCTCAPLSQTLRLVEAWSDDDRASDLHAIRT